LAPAPENEFTMSILFSLRSLALGYAPGRALATVDLSVQAGEFWCILGPNGCGKSTLLKVLLGQLPALGGALDYGPAFPPSAAIGVVPQRTDFPDTVPVSLREFVELGLVGTRIGAREARARVSEALERVGLGDRPKAIAYHALSGGQRQRGSLARALARRPTLLLLDEPTNGLDPTSEHALVQTLARLHAQGGMTMLLVTHDLALAAQCATHAALFDRGTVTAGAITEVLTPDRLRSAYGLPAAAAAGLAAAVVEAHR
jgi:ABC-type Mn2+/Zn2+ transport system ATPase subunit